MFSIDVFLITKSAVEEENIKILHGGVGTYPGPQINC